MSYNLITFLIDFLINQAEQTEDNSEINLYKPLQDDVKFVNDSKSMSFGIPLKSIFFNYKQQIQQSLRQMTTAMSLMRQRVEVVHLSTPFTFQECNVNYLPSLSL